MGDRLARSRGTSLIELMLALSLGIIIAAAVTSTFLVATRMASSQRGNSSVSANGQQVMTHIGQQIRMSGMADVLDNSGTWGVLLAGAGGTGTSLSVIMASAYPGLYALHGCNGAYVAPSTLLSYNCGASSSNLASSLTVAYQALSTSSASWLEGSLPTTFNAQTGLSFDCGGLSPLASNPNASPSGLVVINRYYLDPGGSQRLLCIGNGNPQQPVQIATGVEQFQLLYGVAQASVNQYTANAQYADATSVNAMLNGWGSVISVQLCMMVAGEVGSADLTAGVNVFNLDCAGVPSSVGDGRLRHTYHFVVNVRNNVSTSVTMP